MDSGVQRSRSYNAAHQTKNSILFFYFIFYFFCPDTKECNVFFIRRKIKAVYFCFQSPYYWLSHCWEPENTDYGESHIVNQKTTMIERGNLMYTV